MRHLILICLMTCLVSLLAQSNNDIQQRNNLATSKKNGLKVERSASDLYVDTIPNAVPYILQNLFGGCIEVTNMVLTAAPQSFGVFMDPDTSMGIHYGILLTTGNVYGAAGPNNTGSESTDNAMSGDPDLNSLIPGYLTFDATIIEFDFVSKSDSSLSVEMVFASEEYPEFVGGIFNDVFGFFISGPGIQGTKNIALIPGTSTPIAINNVNDTTNGSYYIDNTQGLDSTLQYDGYTTPIVLNQNVIPDSTYHFKIAIADAGDNIFDSGVFIKNKSFSNNVSPAIANFNYSDSGMVVQFNNNSQNASIFLWEFGDSTIDTSANPTHIYTNPGTYNVTLIASNICHTDTFNLTINVGMSTIHEKTLDYKLRQFENHIDIHIDNHVPESQISLYDIEGRCVYKTPFIGDYQRLFTTKYSSGIYILKLETPNRIPERIKIRL